VWTKSELDYAVHRKDRLGRLGIVRFQTRRSPRSAKRAEKNFGWTSKATGQARLWDAFSAGSALLGDLGIKKDHGTG